MDVFKVLALLRDMTTFLEIRSSERVQYGSFFFFPSYALTIKALCRRHDSRVLTLLSWLMVHERII